MIAALAVALALAAPDEHPPEAPALDTAGAGHRAVTVRGSLFVERYSFAQSRPRGRTNDRSEITFRPTLELAGGGSLDGLATADIREDASDETRARVQLHEAFVRLYARRGSVTAGRQFVRWGRADTNRPADVFRRRDFSDLLEGRDEAIHALRAELPLGGQAAIEGVWVPVLEPDRLPVASTNRWFLLPTQVDVPGLGPVPARYTFAPRASPRGGFGESQLGVRVSAQAGGFDLAAAYARTFDRTPTYFDADLTAAGPQGADVTLTAHHARLHVLGLDGATVLGGFGVRGEVAYTLTEDRLGRDPRVDDPYLRAVLGVDRTLGGVLGEADLFLLAQYAMDAAVPRRGERPSWADQPMIRLRHFYRQAVQLSAELRFGEIATVALKGQVDVERGQYLVQPEGEWRALDGFTISGGIDLPGGPRDTLLGRFRDNARVRLRLEARL